MGKLRILRWGDYPVLSHGGGGNVVTMTLIKGGRMISVRERRWKQRSEEREQIRATGFEDGGSGQGMQAASRSWERQGMDSPPEPPEGARPCEHILDF